MRIKLQLNRVEAEERRAAQRASADHPALDEEVHAVVDALVAVYLPPGMPAVVLLEGIDLHDDGTYLYTIYGEEL